MKIRIGDLITTKSGTGFVIALDDKFYVAKGCVDCKIPKQSLSTIVCREDISKIVPREEVKEYWKYL